MIEWRGPAFPGDNRIVAFCGHVAIGAIFAPGNRGRYWRWRAWCTHLIHPSEGCERSEASARKQVEDRFLQFLELAGLCAARPNSQSAAQIEAADRG